MACIWCDVKLFVQRGNAKGHDVLNNSSRFEYVQQCPPDCWKFVRHVHLVLIHPAFGSRQSSDLMHAPPIGIPRSEKKKNFYMGMSIAFSNF